MNILINKIWFDKWLNYSNYEEIKNNYLEKKENNENNEKEIIDELIYHLEKNNIKYSLLNPIEIINFKTKSEIEAFLKKDSLIIIDSTFFSTKKKNSANYTRYYAYENKIEIPLEDGTFLAKSNDNMIQLNLIINYNNNKNDSYINPNAPASSNENLNMTHIKQLIRIFYFNQKLNEQIQSDQKTGTKNKNDIYLINKNIINKYKEYFNYKTLYSILNNNSKLKQINYDNLENNFDKVI